MAPQIKCKTSNHLLNLTQTQQTLNIGFFGDLLQFSSRGLTSWKYLQYLPLQSPLPSPNAQLTQGHRKNSLCGCYDIICLHENSSQPCSFKKKNFLSCLLWQSSSVCLFQSLCCYQARWEAFLRVNPLCVSRFKVKGKSSLLHKKSS